MDQSTHEMRVREWSQIIQDCNASGLVCANLNLGHRGCGQNVGPDIIKSGGTNV